MITAAEARQLQPKKPSKAQIERVEKFIKEAASNGKTIVYLGVLENEMVTFLKDNGYKVEIGNDRGETVSSISWADTTAIDYYNK